MKFKTHSPNCWCYTFNAQKPDRRTLLTSFKIVTCTFLVRFVSLRCLKFLPAQSSSMMLHAERLSAMEHLEPCSCLPSRLSMPSVIRCLEINIMIWELRGPFLKRCFAQQIKNWPRVLSSLQFASLYAIDISYDLSKTPKGRLYPYTSSTFSAAHNSDLMTSMWRWASDIWRVARMMAEGLEPVIFVASASMEKEARR